MRFLGHFVAFVSAVSAAHAVAPSVLTVNNAGDAGDGTCATTCTLRDAIANVAEGGTIDFDPAILPTTVTLAQGSLNVGKSLRIEGPGAALLQISAAATSRVFAISDGGIGNVSVAITDVTVRDGMVIGGAGVSAMAASGSNGGLGGEARGGCIRMTASGSLTLEGVAIRDCFAQGGEGGDGGSGTTGSGLATGGRGGSGGTGGLAVGGAIYFRQGDGELMLRATSVFNAQALGGMGGSGGDGGSGFFKGEGGRGGDGGAALGSAIYFAGSKMTLVNTTVANCSGTGGTAGNGGSGDPGLATAKGGDGGTGGDALGGLIYLAGNPPPPPAVAFLDFTTAAQGQVAAGTPGSGGNAATPGAGGQLGTAQGAAVWVSGYTATYRSSVIAGQGSTALCYGPLLTAAGAVNLDQDMSCGAAVHATLADAFLPPSTTAALPAYMPVYASAAIDAAASCNDSALLTVTHDEQATDRPQGSACDLGAIEADYVFVNGFN